MEISNKRKICIIFIFSLFFFNFCFDNTSIEEIDEQNIEYNKPYPTSSDTIDTLNLLNYYRKIAGLDEVYIDDTLTKYCKKHIDYMIINSTITHKQDKYLPGYSEEGEIAGRNSNIAYGTDGMYEALEIWINSLYHRIPLLNPKLKKIGFYYKEGYAALDCISGINNKQTDWDYVLFPAPGQKNVKRYFNSQEKPDPIPDGVNLPVGNFITITYNPNYQVSKDLRVKLFDSNENEIDIFVQFPFPENDKNYIYRKNTISIMPKSVLMPLSKYTVVIEGNINNQYFFKKWDFFTDK